MNIIEVENLSHRFSDGTFGIESVSFQIEAGSFVVIAGPNGSGKTTLLRHLNGLLLPTTGTVKVAGVAVHTDPRRARQLVGMMFQDADSQIIGETVYEDVAFGPENLRLDRLEIKQRAERALQVVGLSELAQRRPHLLSEGEKRRLAIASILAMDSRVIVFDEPFSSLDYPAVQQVLQQIVSLNRSGRTILMATHDLEKVIAHADRLIVMNHGRIVRDGCPEKILLEVEKFGIRQPCSSRMGMGLSSWLS
ncbi:MAG: ABC transporter ATP-binding protein [Deltaproteobacteria bacterium]|nr:ABC transporter ATP-binding protein [Deltaproteobacteria bacterium]MBW1960364.1 ABC transporter ATP-binding protein [Deltaproteobacteria bacterium]MBW1993051.1 ABC transporter ATP-binding protein [Deltaproteobacteria bacterium]MBW2151622.1 ABC transporter ATP-binding protein [Deltaproteobacteria bacterium]